MMSTIIKNTFRILIILLIALSSNAYVYGNSTVTTHVISGIVKDSISGEGLPFASVVLLSEKDSMFVKGTTTNIEGKYKMTKVRNGTYLLRISFMGYITKYRKIILRTKNLTIDFSLLRTTASLAQTTITAERNMVQRNINITTVNVTKNNTIVGGTAIDALQTLPSVDIDVDGIISYRGSNKVTILINGDKSAMVKSLDQIPANQIERVELINNPSSKYDAEGMSGIINIVLKSEKGGKNNTTLILYGGIPETLGGNFGYSKTAKNTRFNFNGGLKHTTKYQTKEHFRENYGNPNAYNYYQYDRQDQNLNSAFINTSFKYTPTKKQQIGISFIGSKKYDNADRHINYKTKNKLGETEFKNLKDIVIDLNNYAIDGSLSYKYIFAKGGKLSSKVHYSFFDQLQEMNNENYSSLSNDNPDLQNTFSKQTNQQTDYSLDYIKAFNDSLLLEAGYHFGNSNLINDFQSESKLSNGHWGQDTALNNIFNYTLAIHALYFNLTTQLKHLEIQAGLRVEYSIGNKSGQKSEVYLDFFPAVKLSRRINKHHLIYGGYNRRINRPTIKMLNPFSDEYADILNMHTGNPYLNPEYVNSIEIGNHFTFKKFSGIGSLYFRNIDQAISRVKTATNDSALIVTFINLNSAKMAGAEISLSFKPLTWWRIGLSCNVFRTNMSGSYQNNFISNSKTGWNTSLINNIKLPFNFGFQIAGYYRSKLPSVMGTYQERYYADLGLSKKILKNKAVLAFKISDIFNTYQFGLDLNATDENNYEYSQTNRRKKESRYFVLSFKYNIDGQEQQKNHPKRNFFLDDFDK